MATERESYLQAKLDRLYELTGSSPGMPLEEALQRCEEEWVDDPTALSDDELETSHGILISIVNDLPDARRAIEAMESRYAQVLRSRGLCTEQTRLRRYPV